MTRILGLVTVMMALAGTAACREAAAVQGDALPGRSRPVLEHGWPHPRDLRFDANRFAPADAGAALVTTAAGLRAYVLAAEDDPVVQVTAALPLGRLREQDGEAGAAEILVRLLEQDVEARLGPGFVGRVQIDQEPDLARVSVLAPAGDWRHALGATLGALRGVRVDPGAIAAFRTGPGYARPTRNLGGEGFRPAIELARLSARHPLAPPDAGQPVPPAAVTALAARSLGPRSIVVGVGGGIARADAVRALNELTSGWTGPGATSPPPRPASPPPAGRRFHAIDQPGFTTWIAVGHFVPAIAGGDEAAVAVMGEILNIRLNIAVREIRGLANQAVLHLPAAPQHPGLLHVRTGGRAESVAPLVRYVREELARIREAGGAPTADELEQAKGGLVLSRWQRSLDGARPAAATLAVETVRHGSLDRLYRWPDAVRAVTGEQVRAAAERYIRPDLLATVLIGQIEAVRTSRHPRWPATLPELAPPAAPPR